MYAKSSSINSCQAGEHCERRGGGRGNGQSPHFEVVKGIDGQAGRSCNAAGLRQRALESTNL